MEDVYFKYKFGEDISFELKEGEFVSVIGDNNDLIIHTLLHGNKKATIEVGDTSFSPKTLELWKTHDGIDISAQVGTSVKSIEKGTVEKIYEDSFYGFTVVIDHGQGYKSSYSNLDKSINIKEKQTISKGQIIGKIAKTSIGEIKDEPHLHFTLFKDNNNVDPTYIFK